MEDGMLIFTIDHRRIIYVSRHYEIKRGVNLGNTLPCGVAEGPFFHIILLHSYYFVLYQFSVIINDIFFSCDQEYIIWARIYSISYNQNLYSDPRSNLAIDLTFTAISCFSLSSHSAGPFSFCILRGSFLIFSASCQLLRPEPEHCRIMPSFS